MTITHNFSESLLKQYSYFRILVYGSFITEKDEPSDIDIMVYVVSTPKDAGFNKYKQVQELADENLDIFTLSLQNTFEGEITILTPEEMKLKFNSLGNHIEKGIRCDSFIEIDALVTA